MNRNHESMVRRMRHGQRGQALVMAMTGFVVLLSVGALIIDLGNGYVAYQQLLTATQAAALAGAQVLPTGTAAAAQTAAQQYSAYAAKDNNYHSTLNVTSVSVTVPPCLTTTGVACYSTSNANAITVTEQATVNTVFARLFGVKQIPLAATATASAAGGVGGPYNIMLIADTTGSMTQTDSDSNCSASRLTCSMQGFQTLLETIAPCSASLASCGSPTSSGTATTGANVKNPVNVVGLMTFPGLSSISYAPDDWCTGTEPTTVGYQSSPVYTIVPFSSDFRASDTATSLVASSNLTLALGGTNCTATNVTDSGVWIRGGYGTYYAGVINAAQAALVAEQKTRPNTTNVMILVSDGNAGAAAAYVPSGYQYNQCHEAVTAGQAAAAAGTWVYTVAYGAEASGASSCPTDCTPNSTSCATPTITPCETMEEIAATPTGGENASRFFSDYTSTGGTSTCVGRSQSDTKLTNIFKDIAGDLTVARLIPNGTK